MSRISLREDVAEFFGAFTIILFGAGAQCQAQLYPSASSNMTCMVAWAVGVSLGAYISGGISGGHINPAVTISLAIFRGFVLLGKGTSLRIRADAGLHAATLIVYHNYADAITVLESSATSPVLDAHSAAGNFISIPASNLSSYGAWFDEFLGTAVLVGYIFVFTDKTLNPASNLPFALFLLVCGIAAALGSQTGFAINPARDLGPRLALTLLGYGSDLWTHNHGYWSWGIWLSTIPGGLMGGFMADLFLFTGSDSIINKYRQQGITLP